jgi:beta-lactamase regulating signal transducer with metallopeptidase domain
MTATDTLNTWAAQWAEFMLRGLTDTIFLLAFVALVWLLLRRWASAQLGYCLFLLVLLKLLIPVSITVPGWATWLSPRHVLDQVVVSALVDQRDANLSSATKPNGLPSTPREPGQLQRPVRRDEQMSADPIGSSSAQGTASEAEASSPVLPGPSLSLSAKLMLAWSAVVFILLVRFAWVQWRTGRMLRQAQPLDPASLPVEMEELRRRAGVRGRVQLSVSAVVSSPAVWGLVRPHLVLPPDFDERLTPKQLNWLLLHELAHIRRGDLWIAALQRVVQIVHFFNPAVWLANWAIDQQREYACDDAALAASECPRRDCGTAFLWIVERASALPVSGASALGLLNYRIFVRRRLVRILDQHRRVRPRLSLGAALWLLAVAAIVLPRVQAEDAAPGGPEKAREALASPSNARNSPQGGTAKTHAAAHQAMRADVGLHDQRGMASAGTLPGKIKVKSKLQELWLDNASATDAQLARLEQLTSLRTLSLYSVAGTTDVGLAHLKGLTNLRALSLRCPQITDAGLKNVEGLVNLEQLSLDGDSRVTDIGIGHLRGLTKLRVLGLRATQITDAGLRHLRGLTNLQGLDLAETQVTKAGVDDLQSALPKVHVTWGYFMSGTGG